MKKLLVLLSFASALVLTSCNNDNTVNPKVELGKATVTGTVYAELDNTAAGPEKAQGIAIWARISTKDLVLNPVTGVVYGDKYYQATTDANGVYSIDVDTNPNKENITVTILPQDFTAKVKLNAGGDTKSVVYDGDSKTTTVQVYTGGTFYATDITY